MAFVSASVSTDGIRLGVPIPDVTWLSYTQDIPFTAVSITVIYWINLNFSKDWVFIPFPDFAFIGEVESRIDAAFDGVLDDIQAVRDDLTADLTTLKNDLEARTDALWSDVTTLVSSEVSQAVAFAQDVRADLARQLSGVESDLRGIINDQAEALLSDFDAFRQSATQTFAGLIDDARAELFRSIEDVQTDVAQVEQSLQAEVDKVRADILDSIDDGFFRDPKRYIFEQWFQQVVEDVGNGLLRRLGTLLDAILDEALSDETKQQLRETAERFD